jgi:hypothetical protein
MSGWHLALVYFMAGFGMGFALTAIGFAILISFKAIFGGDYPVLQGCMAGCLEAGLEFGSDAYGDCVNRCMKRRSVFQR